MEQFIDIITNNGMGVCCLIYFMWFNNTVMKDNNKLLSTMDKRLSIIEKCLGLDNKEE